MRLTAKPSAYRILKNPPVALSSTSVIACSNRRRGKVGRRIAFVRGEF
jgi:hypothetical protein